MKDSYINQYHQHILTARKLILEAVYYKRHRAYWEEDRSSEKLNLAEINLDAASRFIAMEENVNEG